MKSGRQGWPAVNSDWPAARADWAPAGSDCAAAGADSAACPPIGADAAGAEAPGAEASGAEAAGAGASGDVVEPISGDVGSGIGDTEPASGVEPADCGVEPGRGCDLGPGESCGKSED